MKKTIILVVSMAVASWFSYRIYEMGYKAGQQHPALFRTAPTNSVDLTFGWDEAWQCVTVLDSTSNRFRVTPLVPHYWKQSE